MKRIYISPVQSFGGEIGNMCTVAMDGGSHRQARVGTVEQLIAVGPNGLPALPWGLVFADFSDQSQALDVPGVYALPEYPYDAKVSGMVNATKSAMLTAFAARGIPTDIAPGTVAYRQVIRALGQMLEPAFDETVGGFAL